MLAVASTPSRRRTSSRANCASSTARARSASRWCSSPTHGGPRRRWSAPGTTASSSPRRSARSHVFNVGDKGSPYYTDDLAGSIREANSGALAERAIVATSVVEASQQALEITGNGSTIVYMGLAGPDDVVKLPMLANLVARTRRSVFSLLYPNQWPKTIRLLRDGVVDTAKIITHSGPLDGINDGDRAGLRSRGRRHQDRRHPELRISIETT